MYLAAQGCWSRWLAVAASAVSLIAVAGSAAWAGIPRTVAFQGVLTNSAGAPKPNGSYTVTFRLYDGLTAGTLVWTEPNRALTVSNGRGMFSTTLGAPTSFGNLAFDKPYFLEVQVSGDAPMTPRVPLQSVPYALNAWSIGGNSGLNPASSFLGTTDNQPLALRVNGRRAVQYEEVANAGNTYHSVNVLAGSDANSIAPGVIGGAIAGGGTSAAINDLRGDFGVIGGGAGNFLDAAPYIVIGGGSGNNGQADYSFIGGGQSNNTQGQWSVIGGGSGNYAGASQATVAGGHANQATGPLSAIGGGDSNMAPGMNAAVSGGFTNQATGSASFVGAGQGNVAGEIASVVGGYQNKANGLRSFIGGGYGNSTSVGYDSAIGGGQNNVATGGDASIGGGYQNQAAANDSTVAGGAFNVADGESATVAGGSSNSASSTASTVAGGDGNRANGACSAVSGGKTNVASGQYSMVPGGFFSVAGGAATFAAGYRAVSLYNGSFVWSDYSAEQDFAASAANQFCIRAKGGLVVESFGDVPLYTSSGTANLNRYVSLLNSPTAPSASGLKAGGILCADSFGYASPGKNDMVVKGTLAVGYPAPSPYTLAVNGSVYSMVGYSSSDARYKRNVETVRNAISAVASLRGVTFDWDRNGWKQLNFPEGRQIGFIAQEVEKALPEVVSTDQNGFKSVAYQNIVPVLVEAVKEQQREIEALRAEAAAARAKAARVDDLEARLQRLETAAAGHR